MGRVVSPQKEEPDALAHMLDVIRCSNVEKLYSEVLRLRQVERAAILLRDKMVVMSHQSHAMDLLTRAIADEDIDEEDWDL